MAPNLSRKDARILIRRLTPRRLEMLVFVVEQQTPIAIATPLSLSIHTVYRHRTAIYHTLHVGCVEDAVQIAYLAGVPWLKALAQQKNPPNSQ